MELDIKVTGNTEQEILAALRELLINAEKDGLEVAVNATGGIEAQGGDGGGPG